MPHTNGVKYTYSVCVYERVTDCATVLGHARTSVYKSYHNIIIAWLLHLNSQRRAICVCVRVSRTTTTEQAASTFSVFEANRVHEFMQSPQ